MQALFGAASVVAGMSVAFVSAPRKLSWRVSLWLVSAYINGVLIYNVLDPERRMSFFGLAFAQQ